eukprot:TRINITY_DN7882_c0_g1_i1.p1 TRINITY_DN7882_c0_g1~~TRINITY_DN7882_c0_g1_i1.p1  ORF type:complete len:603 (+),score=69.38 TRINITY_DN7882_c0_g1_i1:41-1810(+)
MVSKDEQGPSRLVIIGHARAGTTLLTSLLRCNKQTAIVHAEPLDLRRDVKDALGSIGSVLESAEKDNTDGTIKYIGCRVTPEQMSHHNLTILDLTTQLGVNTIIVVTRNKLVEILASQKLTERTGIGYAEVPPSPTAAREKTTIPESEAIAFHENSVRIWWQLLADWPGPHSGVTTLFSSFEKISSTEYRTDEVSRLWSELCCESVEVSTPMIRQHPGDIAEKVSNYSEIQNIVSKLQHIDVEGLYQKRWGIVAIQPFEQPKKVVATVSEHTKATQLLSILVASVLVFHCIDSLVKERIFFMDGFTYASLLTLLQCLTVTTSACFDYVRPTAKKGGKSTPWHLYACLGAFLATSTYTANRATMYLNYPTQVIFKSSKLIWTLTGSHFIFKKKKSFREWAGGVAIATGLVFVGRGASSLDKKDGSHNLIPGLSMIVVSTSADAGINLLQEWMLQNPEIGACKREILLFMQMFSLIPALSLFLLSGSVPEAMDFVRNNPLFLVLVLAAGVSSFIGTRAIIQIISSYDSSTAVLITSIRKVVTLLLSYFFFPKPWTINHFIGITMVIVGGNFSIFDAIKRRATRQLQSASSS